MTIKFLLVSSLLFGFGFSYEFKSKRSISPGQWGGYTGSSYGQGLPWPGAQSVWKSVRLAPELQQLNGRISYGAPRASTPIIIKQIVVEKPIAPPQQVERLVPVPVEKIVNVPVEKLVPYPVEKIVNVPVEKLVPYPVEKIVQVPVEKIIHVPIEKSVPFPVPHVIPYIVNREVPITVEKPVTIQQGVPYPVPFLVSAEGLLISPPSNNLIAPNPLNIGLQLPQGQSASQSSFPVSSSPLSLSNDPSLRNSISSIIDLIGPVQGLGRGLAQINSPLPIQGASGW